MTDVEYIDSQFKVDDFKPFNLKKTKEAWERVKKDLVIWKEFSKVKPKEENDYLVTLKKSGERTVYHWDGENFTCINPSNVEAWSSLPRVFENEWIKDRLPVESREYELKVNTCYSIEVETSGYWDGKNFIDPKYRYVIEDVICWREKNA